MIATADRYAALSAAAGSKGWHRQPTPAPAVRLQVLRRLHAHDAAKREKAKARNDLEAYIIATRDKVCARRGSSGVGWWALCAGAAGA